MVALASYYLFRLVNYYGPDYFYNGLELYGYSGIYIIFLVNRDIDVYILRDASGRYGDLLVTYIAASVSILRRRRGVY